MNYDKYLPIGTVVMLKGGNKRIMISGFCAVDSNNKDKIYDYSGCIYPEGFLSSKQTYLFNHNQIKEICYLGFIDSEEQEFKVKLSDLIENI